MTTLSGMGGDLLVQVGAVIHLDSCLLFWWVRWLEWFVGTEMRPQYGGLVVHGVKAMRNDDRGAVDVERVGTGGYHYFQSHFFLREEENYASTHRYLGTGVTRTIWRY